MEAASSRLTSIYVIVINELLGTKQLDDYITPYSNANVPVKSQVPVAPIQNQNQQQPIGENPDGNKQYVTPQPAGSNRIIGREERIEYRDEAGNLLEPKEVARLQAEGKVSLQTKYQTQTRVIDASGNQIIKNSEHAPPHPDVEGQNPETNRNGEESVARNEPASVAGLEKSVYDEQVASAAKPASEAQGATK